MTAFDPSGPACSDGLFGLPTTPDEAHFVVIPVPWEPTTSYGRGTAGGPEAIRAASQQVDLFDLDFGRPYERGIAMLPLDPAIVALGERAAALALPIIDAGGVEAAPELAAKAAEVDRMSDELNAWVQKQTAIWLDRGRIVGVLGGDHSSPFGAISEIARRHDRLSILHIDAHADLRRAYEGFRHSHASIFFNVLEAVDNLEALCSVGVRDLCEEEHRLAAEHPKVFTTYDPTLRDELAAGVAFDRIVDRILEPLGEHVYVSFDIDGLDPSLCPHTGTPVPGGLSFREATRLLQRLSRSGKKIVGFDLCEVAKGPDDEWDANVGARVLYKLIGAACQTL